MPSAAPIRAATLVSTQQGVEILLRNDLTPFRDALQFSPQATKNRPALRLSRTKNLRLRSVSRIFSDHSQNTEPSDMASSHCVNYVVYKLGGINSVVDTGRTLAAEGQCFEET